MTEGNPVVCELTVSNTRRLSTSDLEVTEIINGRPERFRVGMLAGRSATQVCDYLLPAKRRGVYELPPPVVEIIDPARVIRRRFNTFGTTTFYVHPRYDDIPGFEAGNRLDADGLAFLPVVGGVAFYSLRDYIAGDDPRLIHWPSTARTGTLKVRHNGVPDSPGYLLILHTATAPYTDESFEDAIRVAASLAVAATRTGARLYLRTTNRQQAPPDRTGTPVTSALDFLAAVARDESPVRWSTALVPDQDIAGITVVTGEITDEEVSAIARAGDPGTSLLVIRVVPGARSGRARGPVDVMTVSSSSEFVANWDGQ
ncbi:DUF58 domain-containing protein [Kibdelosporangium aridum]|uniref:DUF58 domain-containing protein n=1 Tax=Kibdelosporangium aridum TaxID=2030 RepID=UPI0035E4E8FE